MRPGARYALHRYVWPHRSGICCAQACPPCSQLLEKSRRCLSALDRKFVDHRDRQSATPETDLQALSGSLSFAILPKSSPCSFSNVLRRVFLLVLLHPTRAGCLNYSFEAPFTFF